MSRSWSTMPSVKNTAIPISTFLHVGTFWIFLGYRMRKRMRNGTREPWSFCAFEGLYTLSPWIFFRKQKLLSTEWICFSIASLVATFRLQTWLARTIWLLQEPLLALKWIIWIIVIVPKASTSVRPILSFYSWSMDKYAWKVQISLRCALCVKLPFRFFWLLQMFSIWQEKMEVIHRAKRRWDGNWLGCCLLIPQWHVASDWYPISSMSGRSTPPVPWSKRGQGKWLP